LQSSSTQHLDLLSSRMAAWCFGPSARQDVF
jgi:hypothetical protein